MAARRLSFILRHWEKRAHHVAQALNFPNDIKNVRYLIVHFVLRIGYSMVVEPVAIDLEPVEGVTRRFLSFIGTEKL